MTSCLSTAVAMDGNLLWIHTRYIAALSWRRNEFFKVKGHFLCKCIFYSQLNYKECFHYFFIAYRNGWKPMHKRGIIRYANYTVCASVFIHFCMQRKNNENIPIIAITNGIPGFYTVSFYFKMSSSYLDKNKTHEIYSQMLNLRRKQQKLVKLQIF